MYLSFTEAGYMSFLKGTSVEILIRHFLKEYPTLRGTIHLIDGESRTAASYSDAHITDVGFNAQLWQTLQTRPISSAKATREGDAVNITVIL